MSKSLGNFFTIGDALTRWPADAIRLWVLTSHYRIPIAFTEEALDAAKRGVERLRVAARGRREGSGDEVDVTSCRQQFIEAMDDDLNTPRALASLHELARDINRARDEGRPTGEAQGTLLELADVLGLTLAEPEADMSAAPFIELLISLRNELRAAKQYELGDRVRSGLAEIGIALEDTPQGTGWKRRE
jgi:cysteinyl-tRNA synthetase